MAQEQFISAVLPQHSRSVTDQYLEAEAKELEKYTIITKGEAKNIRSVAKANADAVLLQPEYIGMVNNAKPLLFDIDPKTFFALNYSRYNIYFRNHMIVEYATDRVNRTAGIVMKTFFRNGKEKMKYIKEDYSPASTPVHIANMLDPDVFQRNDLVLQQPTAKKHKAPDVIDVVKGYFRLLQTDSAGFLTKRDELGANQYAVNLKRIRHAMKRALLEGLLTERFGVASCRIVRILLDKGKLDEAQIQKLAMLPAVDVKLKLDILLTNGIVEIQEVPRSSDRTTSRSFHLWFVSIDKCYTELIADIYRTLANLQQRKNEELVQRSRLLEKLGRIDVLANMELLNEIDKAEVAKMENVVARMEISKGRLDAMLMILRDF
ncbi:hypothetical protein BD408DRAFT_345036 [Parasitella parasitica]|nr:hypothetical protein BD408DRAFT_345036 [Parasitella parasitica]